jgi:hypothetical protein
MRLSILMLVSVCNCFCCSWETMVSGDVSVSFRGGEEINSLYWLYRSQWIYCCSLVIYYILLLMA